jgi:chitinase
LRRPTLNDKTRGPSPTTTTRRPAVTSSGIQSQQSQGNFNPFTTPEPPTTPDSIVDFECKEEGFYPNAKDCKKYFWCLDTAAGMVSHIFTCPAGELISIFPMPSRSTQLTTAATAVIIQFLFLFSVKHKENIFVFLFLLLGLHFNKFTDSCDYATNVICKTGAGATTTTTTPKPFLTISSSTTTTTARPTTTRRPTTTTTTTTITPEPEQFDYVDEVVPQSLAKNSDSTPDELQQLLQLISDLGSF